MTNGEIDNMILNLREALETTVSHDCIKLVLTFTASGFCVEKEYRSSSSLIRDGISMRNIKGEWIE